MRKAWPHSLSLILCDVGPRDGLQNESEVLEPAVRAELVNRLAAAGLPRVEAVSFVRADRVPQMAGAEEVAAGIHPRDGTEYSGLVLNEQGYERFAAAGLDRVNETRRASGNVATEDLVYLLEHEGIGTGVDLDALIRISEWLETVLGRKLEGQVYRAGLFPNE